jgi:hypothetical protein
MIFHAKNHGAKKFLSLPFAKRISPATFSFDPHQFQLPGCSHVGCIFHQNKKGNHMSTQTMSHDNATIGSLVWFEIPADNLDRARKFYSGLFNWKISPFQGMQGPEAQKYLHIETGGVDASPDGGLTTREHIQGITQYINVASVDESSAQVEKLGGKVRARKTAVPQMGYYAICQDTENNTFAIWESDSDAR